MKICLYIVILFCHAVMIMIMRYDRHTFVMIDNKMTSRDRCVIELNRNNIVTNEFETSQHAGLTTSLSSSGIRSCCQGYIPDLAGRYFTYAPEDWPFGIFPIIGKHVSSVDHFNSYSEKVPVVFDTYAPLLHHFKLCFEYPGHFVIYPKFTSHFHVTGEILRYGPHLRWNGARSIYKQKKLKKTNLQQLLEIDYIVDKAARIIQKHFRTWSFRQNCP